MRASCLCSGSLPVLKFLLPSTLNFPSVPLSREASSHSLANADSHRSHRAIFPLLCNKRKQWCRPCQWLLSVTWLRQPGILLLLYWSELWCPFNGINASLSYVFRHSYSVSLLSLLWLRPYGCHHSPTWTCESRSCAGNKWTTGRFESWSKHMIPVATVGFSEKFKGRWNTLSKAQTVALLIVLCAEIWIWGLKNGGKKKL